LHLQASTVTYKFLTSIRILLTPPSFPTFLSRFSSFAPNSAILRDSHVLLLDEISAALDSVSEAALHSALQRVLKVRLEVALYVEYCL